MPLPEPAIEALAAIPTENYYFWSGQGTKKSCVGDYQRAFKKLYKLAEVSNATHTAGAILFLWNSSLPASRSNRSPYYSGTNLLRSRRSTTPHSSKLAKNS